MFRFTERTNKKHRNRENKRENSPRILYSRIFCMHKELYNSSVCESQKSVTNSLCAPSVGKLSCSSPLLVYELLGLADRRLSPRVQQHW